MLPQIITRATAGYEFEDSIRPLGPDSHLKKYLAARGPGLHHICFQVENLEDACDQVVKAGGQLVGQTSATNAAGTPSFIPKAPAAF